jgi:fucose permease
MSLVSGRTYAERQTIMKQKLGPWLPAIYCAILSLICLAAFLIRSESEWFIIFLCFLPMGFVFAATVTSNLQREIRELREQVEKLQEK